MSVDDDEPFDNRTQTAFRRLSEKDLPFAEEAQKVVEYHGLKE
jgi:hypothetical protein